MLAKDTRRVISENPDYWIKWYTYKSLALVVAAGVIGYLLGQRRR